MVTSKVAWIVRAPSPECHCKDGSENRYVDCDDSDHGLANAPSVDARGGRNSVECENGAHDGCCDDENTCDSDVSQTLIGAMSRSFTDLRIE